MTNKTKIIIGILIVVAIIVLVLGILNSNIKKVDNNGKKDGFSNIANYIDDITPQEGEFDNSINDIEDGNNVIVENSVNEGNTVQNDNVVGREEQDSKNENTEANNRSVAIELAKKEWNISVDSYNFEAEFKSDGIYEVSVRNKTNGYVNAVYTVNVKTGTVTE